MLIRIHQDGPESDKVREVVSILKKDGVVVCPTDTVYSFACLLGSSKGFERIARLKGLRPNKAHFSILCSDLSDL
ncbi:MAG: Sua5/YciO/YrdC/YwlC family protein, partial [Bacteroidota bacterium]|nr:Sua5/YciO/YrdC/YwlC family protein [Bacteroidota bacterium]